MSSISTISESTSSTSNMPLNSWSGVTRLNAYHQNENDDRNNLATFASKGQWDEWFAIVDTEWGPYTEYVNSWKLQKKRDETPQTLFTALHYTAYNENTPIEVVEKLIKYGAWRTIRTADGKIAQDIALERGNVHLVKLLAPQIKHEIQPDILENLQKGFEEVLDSTSFHEINKGQNIRIPQLELLTELDDPSIDFTVPGMYGGYEFKLQQDMTLVILNSCRISYGWGGKHVVWPSGKWKQVEAEYNNNMNWDLEWPVKPQRKGFRRCIVM